MPTRPPALCRLCGETAGCECLNERSPARRYRSSAQWTGTSRRVLEAWRAEHGDWCPGLPGRGHRAHRCLDLTVDHVDALAVHGADTGRYRVLCREWNARLGAETR